MKKFWKWMKKKYDYEENIIYEGDMDGVYFEKQMLIGYMFEYLIEKKEYKFFSAAIGIDRVYTYLERKIEGLK